MAKEKFNSYFKTKVNVDFEEIRFRECEQKKGSQLMTTAQVSEN